MNEINNDILLLIFNKLPKSHIIKRENLSLVNKKFYSILNTIVQEVLLIKKNWIKDNYPEEIINMFGGLDKMKYFPYFRWKNKYIGSTSYIDQIKPKYNKYTILTSLKDLFHGYSLPMVLF